MMKHWAPVRQAIQELLQAAGVRPQPVAPQPSSGISLREAMQRIVKDKDWEDIRISADEARLLHNLLHLRDMRVRELMVPRGDIAAIEVNTPHEQLLALMADSRHTRYPVYRQTLDEVLGMLHIKDLFLINNRQTAVVDIASILRDVIYVSPTMRARDLLLEMQNRRIHMALVVDEHGGVDGLVTIEDLVEQIVGQIDDEHDDAEVLTCQAHADGSWLVDARMSLDELEKQMGPILSEDERSDIQTVGGLAIYLANGVPSRGEVLRHASGFEFEVIDGDPRSLKKLRLRLPKSNAISAP